MTPSFSDTIVSYIRTYVPVIVGTAIGWAVAAGLPLSTSTQGDLTAALAAAAVAAWYALARLLEAKFPWAGWLLGVPRQPVYTAAVPLPVRDPA